MKTLETEKVRKEKLDRVSEYYKGKLESDIENILSNIETIIKGAIIGGGLSLLAFQLISKPSNKTLSKSKTQDAEDVETAEVIEDLDDNATDVDNIPIEKSSFDLPQVFKQGVFGVVSSQLIKKGVEFAMLAILNEAKKKLVAYMQELDELNSELDNDKP